MIPGRTYRELQPAPRLAGHLWTVWIHRVPGDAAPYTHRSVPNGTVELACGVGAVPRIVGPRTRATVEMLEPGTTVVGARFHPGAAPSVLGVPASELLDLTLDSDALWGRWAVALGERVAGAASPLEAVAVLQAQIIGRLDAAAGPDPLVAEAVRRLMPGRTDDVGSLTSSLSISERQLRRRSLAGIGLAPKALQRMLRFQGFLARVQFELARGRAPAAGGLARLAADAGYADQSHLSRECDRLTGLPPRAFLRETEHQCVPEHDHAASFLPLLRAAAPD